TSRLPSAYGSTRPKRFSMSIITCSWVRYPPNEASGAGPREFPPTLVPGAEDTKPITVPFIGDIALLGETGSHHNPIWADLELAPGEHDVMLLLPPLPTKCRLDGVLADFQYDRHWRTARVHVTTPALPYRSITLN